MLATVWRIPVEVGDAVGEGAVLVILESMKMEIPVPAPCHGTVVEVAVEEGQAVDDGDLLARLEPSA
jgi:acetyl-CoA carboxylase biotin carboxyl carrier protein